MSSEEWRPRLAEAAAGDLNEADTARLDAHLRQCADCREALARLRSVWDELGRLPVPQPPADAAERFARVLAGEQQAAGQRGLPVARLAAAAAGLLLIGGLAGYALRGATDSPTTGLAQTGTTAAAGAPADASMTFLLLLIEEPGELPPAEQDRIVAEYAAWGSELAQEGRLVSAEKLTDEPGLRLRGSTAPSATAETLPVGGYFIIRARDYNEARSIAESSPHLRYGGAVEIRAIDET